ncbi:uncharacterized protein Z520_11695 [Fonsecaea multimorphosa CBS 102226]|uniref:peptidylprolyl isomerase n=1 Tax=Fonsecaea multimorphosa CBS 102226 TaxID=1442371 RepID=A0A0D2I5X4_9EURO|nr:uncharacterized protein Z520_11695 [Fonsecaea multimorphosa CBS 102226]KIX92666.1 hypothetical protein Z520_11695 [Fonsecaea multimorphosa CBS 102226]OAL17889.1 hypothetical protein AYO22_11233 [Fonsecaea multimorphosa]
MNVAMARYKIAFFPPKGKGDRLDLLVEFDGNRTISDLTGTVIERASKYRSLPNYVRHDWLQLCLGSEDGSLIDHEAIIQDVITTTDVLFIIFLDAPRLGAQIDHKKPSEIDALRIRVIIPKEAQGPLEKRSITFLKAGHSYPPSSTLKEIRDDIAQYLQLPAVWPRNAFPTKLDLHTIQGPISTNDLSLTLKEAGLNKLATNNVLTIYAVVSASSRQKESPPTELVVFCVDRSHSMCTSSGFLELEGTNNNDSVTPIAKANADVISGDEDVQDASLDEIKSWLRGHESYEDIIHIIRYCPSGAAKVVQQILELLRFLTIREIDHLTTGRETVTTSARFSHVGMGPNERQMRSLQRILAGINLHQRALSDILIYSAKDPWFESKQCVWTYGDDLPPPPPSATEETIELGDFCVVPQEYRCPISHDLFQDPVCTSDGFRFDRKAIEFWYRDHKSNPLTQRPIADTTLRHDEVKANQIKAWVKAEDVINSLPSTARRTESQLSIRLSGLIINFVGLSCFSRELPESTRLLDLYKVAFRGMRGRYAKFSLHVRDVYLPCTKVNMLQKGVLDGETITINPNYISRENPPRGSTSQEQMCLIRVYNTTDFSKAHFSKESFNYWVPVGSQLTYGSIIFRNWRYDVQHRGVTCFVYDQSVKTDFKDLGDDGIGFTRRNSWESLSKDLRDVRPKEVREHEPLYQLIRDAGKKSDATRREPYTGAKLSSATAGDAHRYGHCRVFKVALSQYERPEEIERRKVRDQKASRLSRMDVTKQVCSQFFDRLIAYGYPTTVGLVTFGTDVRLTQWLTGAVENVREAVDAIDAGGNTALWDALVLAANHLISQSQSYPGIKKRIICISDGRDTGSVCKAEEVCGKLFQHRIVVDSIALPGEDTRALRTISHLTGGYKFRPTSLEQALALCELEPVLSIHERPRNVRFMSAQPFDLPWATEIPELEPDPLTRDKFPALKTHKNLHDPFIQVGYLERVTRSMVPEETPRTPTSPTTPSRRLLAEIRDIAYNPHPDIDVFVSERNMGFWKIVLEGARGSAYAKAAFVLYLDMGKDYPRKAPIARFVTPILHPNVNRHGRICHPTLDRDWTVHTTNKEILDNILGLLLVPEFEDLANTVAAEDYYRDEVAFKQEVERHCDKHAWKSRAMLGRDILAGR